jgi:hypothetical protein
MSDLKIPTIHLNGTSKDALFQQVCNAIDAVHAAGDALAQATPNGRDYYPQGQEAIYAAMRQHEARMTKLREVARELETIAQAIM